MGIASADGNFSVGVHALLQTRFEHVESDTSRQDGFRIGSARPALRGVAFRKWLSYFVQWELAGPSATLLDMEVVARPIPELGLKVGQFLTPFSREFLVPPGALLFPDFAPSNVLFRDNRDTGAMLLGQAWDKRLEYYAAVVNGNGINRNGNDNAQLEWIGRLAVNAFGQTPYTEIPQLVTNDPGLALGMNASYADMEQTATTLDAATGATTTRRLGSSPTTKVGADVAFHAGPVSVQVEGYSRTIRAVANRPRQLARGGFAQIGCFVVPRTLELAARGDLIDTDAYKSAPLDKRIDAGANWYIRANQLKLQLRYGRANSPNAVAPSPKGSSDTVSLQAQLWF